MFGKLIKYDFRCCIRKFGPLWLGLAALALINGFTVRHVLENDAVSGWLQFFTGVTPLILLIVLWTAVGIMALVFICERFYKGLLGDEGYLMFTLPVTTGEHIAAKTVVALLLELITGVVAVLSAFLFILMYDASLFPRAGELIARFFAEFDVPAGVWWILAELVVMNLIMAVAQTLHIYLAICLGHLSSKHRAGLAVLAYIAISMALSNLATLFIPLLEKLPDDWFVTIDALGQLQYNGVGAAAALIGVGILAALLQCAIFYFGSSAIIQRRLNLE